LRPLEHAFLNKFRQKIGIDIIALSAEDHYVRVYTPVGSDLILYRFSDAMAEMPDGVGLQVHRSHWVRKSAITAFKKKGNGHYLVLGVDTEIAVSKRFVELLKAHGIVLSE